MPSFPDIVEGETGEVGIMEPVEAAVGCMTGCTPFGWFGDELCLSEVQAPLEGRWYSVSARVKGSRNDCDYPVNDSTLFRVWRSEGRLRLGRSRLPVKVRFASFPAR